MALSHSVGPALMSIDLAKETSLTLKMRAAELEDNNTDVQEDREQEFERELQKWEQGMELDRGHSSRMQRITELVQAEVRAERRGAASGPGRGANGGQGARHGGQGRQGQGTGGRRRGECRGSCLKLNNPEPVKDAIVPKGFIQST
jgi:hypothetical protein